ncbi:MAG: hypothetical protein ACRBF0_24545 [Calditrichia bacterium]
MSCKFEQYRDRRISFLKLAPIGNWQVKVYGITMHEAFSLFDVVEKALEMLPKWLPAKDNPELPVYDVAWLIAHEGREGVWLLLNWWVGGEMMETVVYFASYDTPDRITASPYQKNALLCVWELQVISHERHAWIKHILKKAEKPDFTGYLEDVKGEW